MTTSVTRSCFKNTRTASPRLQCTRPRPSYPYLTLPYGEVVLPPSAEASNGPNAHPRINRKVTKSQVQYSPGSIPTCGTILSQERAYSNLLTNIQSWYLQKNISSKAHKHLYPGHHDQQDSKPENHQRVTVALFVIYIWVWGSLPFRLGMT